MGKKYHEAAAPEMVNFSNGLPYERKMANATLYVPAGHNNVEVVKYLLNLAGSETIELEAKNMSEVY